MHFFDYIKSRKNKDILADDSLKEYDDTSPKYPNQILNGIHAKKFYRCDSALFDQMFDEIRNNPNCSYKTYLNDLIKQEKDYIPERVSAMLKITSDVYSHSNDIIDNFASEKEVLSSRIANFLGVPTVYNKKIRFRDSAGILSVDFLKSDEKILDFDDDINMIESELDMDRPGLFDNMNLEQTMARLNSVLFYYEKMYNFDHQQILKDILTQYFVKTYVLDDRDFGYHNVGVTCDKNNCIQVLPMFDYEMTFSNSNNNNIYEDFRYATCLDYTNILENINLKFKELIKPDNLKKLTKDLNSQFVHKAKVLLKSKQQDFDKYLDISKYMLTQNEKF